MKNALKKPLTKSILISLALTAAASGADAGTHKIILVSAATIFIITNEKMVDIMKIVKSLVEYGLLTKRVSETIKNEAK